MNITRDNDRLVQDGNAADLSYKIVRGLLYFKDLEYGLRLCIPKFINGEVFKLAHDELSHPGYARTHERLIEGLYLFNLHKRLHEYIRHCP